MLPVVVGDGSQSRLERWKALTVPDSVGVTQPGDNTKHTANATKPPSFEPKAYSTSASWSGDQGLADTYPSLRSSDGHAAASASPIWSCDVQSLNLLVRYASVEQLLVQQRMEIESSPECNGTC